MLWIYHIHVKTDHTVLSCFHSQGENHWCHGRWHGWDGPAHHGRVDRRSNGGRPPSHHSCPWGFGVPDPAKGLGQSLLCPGNGWTPSRWHCWAEPACQHGGRPVRQSWARGWTPLRSLGHRYYRWGCSSADGEGWNDSWFFFFFFFYWGGGGREKKKTKKFLWKTVWIVREYIKCKWEIYGSLLFERLIFNSLYSLVITTIMQGRLKKRNLCWLIPLLLISIDSATAMGDSEEAKKLWGVKCASYVKKRGTPGNRTSSARLFRGGDGRRGAETSTDCPCTAITRVENSHTDLCIIMTSQHSQCNKCKDTFQIYLSQRLQARQKSHHSKNDWGVRKTTLKGNRQTHGSCEERRKTHIRVIIEL